MKASKDISKRIMFQTELQKQTTETDQKQYDP